MKTSISMLSALLLLGSGSVLAQQPGQEQPGAQQPGQQQPGAQQPGQQPGQEQPGAQQPGAQPGAQPDDHPALEDDADRDRDRDTDIAAADRPRDGETLERREQGQIRSDELVGSDVMDQQDENVGTVDELLIDEQDGQIAALLINVGGVVGVGGRTVALPWDSVELQRDEEDGVFQDRYTIRTQMTRQELEDAPEFQDDEQNGNGVFGN